MTTHPNIVLVHGAMVSHPAEVTQLIEKAAAAVQTSG